MKVWKDGAVAGIIGMASSSETGYSLKCIIHSYRNLPRVLRISAACESLLAQQRRPARSITFYSIGDTYVGPQEYVRVINTLLGIGVTYELCMVTLLSTWDWYTESP